MIDVSPYIEKLDKLKNGVDSFVDKLAFSKMWHLRIIYEIPIPFPMNYEWVGYDSLIEVSNIPWDKHERKGWSKPDVQCGNVEVRYLWKNPKPKLNAD